jgi:hypothetical protein
VYLALNYGAVYVIGGGGCCSGPSFLRISGAFGLSFAVIETLRKTQVGARAQGMVAEAIAAHVDGRSVQEVRRSIALGVGAVVGGARGLAGMVRRDAEVATAPHRARLVAVLCAAFLLGGVISGRGLLLIAFNLLLAAPVVVHYGLDKRFAAAAGPHLASLKAHLAPVAEVARTAWINHVGSFEGPEESKGPEESSSKGPAPAAAAAAAAAAPPVPPAAAILAASVPDLPIEEIKKKVPKEQASEEENKKPTEDKVEEDGFEMIDRQMSFD